MAHIVSDAVSSRLVADVSRRGVVNGIRLQEIGSLIDTGKLGVIVEQEFPPNRAAAALELSESGHVRGKIILTVAS